MSSLIRCLSIAGFLIVGYCFIFSTDAISQTAEKPLIDEDAQSLLKSVVRSFGAANNGRIHVDSEVTFRMQGMEDNYTKEYVFAWERPNKFAWRTGAETTGPSVISDGSKLFHYIESTSAYVESDAPVSLAELDLFPNDEDHIQGVRNPETIYHDFLLGADPWKELTRGMKSITFERDDSNAEGVHTIRLEREDFAYTFWVKKGDAPSLVKIKPEWNDFIAQGGIAGSEGLSIENEIQLSDWQLGSPVDPSVFQFTPGDGIRKAASLDDALTPPPPPAPDFSIQLMDGGEFKLSEYKGKKVVVLDFWATWCPPCRAAMPVMEEIAETYKDDVVILALNQQEPAETVKSYLSKNGFHPMVALDGGRVAGLYEVSVMPTFVIIDKEGMMRDYIPGFDPDIEKRIQALVD
ncbi:MAG: redoxin domain-containing protein [Candidatus Hinthialibacter antarcticus]|nr:redoxin domain-containing protein [Candidatus Hinthialibacter antarcticus]